MATAVTIHGGQGSDTISFAFTVTGTNTTAYTQQFATNVNALLVSGVITPVLPTNDTVGSSFLGAGAAATPVYVLDAPTVTGAPVPDYTIAAAGYVLDTISGAANITLAGGGADTVLVAAINAEALITAGVGGNNQVIFVTGQNAFVGTTDAGGDTIVGGSGKDTIYTSMAGSTTVNSGTGEATIYLQDTGTAAANGFVWLNDGSNTVYANGINDAVVSTTESQTIYGDSATGAAGHLGVVLLANSDGTTNGYDMVNAMNTSTVAAFDYSSDNTVIGGSGLLYFIGGDSITATVDGGAGTAFLYGSSGDSITLDASSSTGGTGLGYFVAGGGNETLNGAGATGNLYLFGGQADTSSSAVAVSDSLVGGGGSNLLTAGAGSETLQGGTGTNVFQISEVTSDQSNLLLTDFAVNGTPSTLILDGFSQADLQNLYNSTDNTPAGLVVTLGNSTSITFSGITSGAQLQGHVITFGS